MHTTTLDLGQVQMSKARKPSKMAVNILGEYNKTIEVQPPGSSWAIGIGACQHWCRGEVFKPNIGVMANGGAHSQLGGGLGHLCCVCTMRSLIKTHPVYVANNAMSNFWWLCCICEKRAKVLAREHTYKMKEAKEITVTE